MLKKLLVWPLISLLTKQEFAVSEFVINIFYCIVLFRFGSNVSQMHFLLEVLTVLPEEVCNSPY